MTLTVERTFVIVKHSACIRAINNAHEEPVMRAKDMARYRGRDSRE